MSHHATSAQRSVTRSSGAIALREARRLLAYTDAPVADVAQELGFDDPAYFSRFFARRSGVSPSSYRVALQNGTAVEP